MTAEVWRWYEDLAAIRAETGILAGDEYGTSEEEAEALRLALIARGWTIVAPGEVDW